MRAPRGGAGSRRTRTAPGTAFGTSYWALTGSPTSDEAARAVAVAARAATGPCGAGCRFAGACLRPLRFCGVGGCRVSCQAGGETGRGAPPEMPAHAAARALAQPRPGAVSETRPSTTLSGPWRGGGGAWGYALIAARRPPGARRRNASWRRHAPSTGTSRVSLRAPLRQRAPGTAPPVPLASQGGVPAVAAAEFLALGRAARLGAHCDLRPEGPRALVCDRARVAGAPLPRSLCWSAALASRWRACRVTCCPPCGQAQYAAVVAAPPWVRPLRWVVPAGRKALLPGRGPRGD